jgi:ribosome-binding protein aMBF1 (putative translation factor)
LGYSQIAGNICLVKEQRLMEKSVFSHDYAIFLTHLRTVRKRAGLTQEAVAVRLGQSQSFVSKCERGERRIDVIELNHFCHAIGISLSEFIDELTSMIEEARV